MSASCPLLKPVTRYLPSDWYKNIYQSLVHTDNSSRISQALRDRFETNMKILDATIRNGSKHNNRQLSRRISDVFQWKIILGKTSMDVSEEFQKLSAAKDEVERALHEKTLPHHVNKFCLVMRDRRANFESGNKDSVEDELIKESKLIEATKVTLNSKCNEMFDLLIKLQTIRNLLEDDLRNKQVAFAIDCDIFPLNANAATNGSKPKPVRISDTPITTDQWLAASQDNVANAACEIKRSKNMRHAIGDIVARMNATVNSQFETTDAEYHKRMHLVGRAIDEMQWQKKNLEEEIASLARLLINLKDSCEAKKNILKLVESRLETRGTRHHELSVDEPYVSLLEQKKKLENNNNSLHVSLLNTRGKINSLNATLQHIESNLRDKQIAHQIDQACVEERKRIRICNRRKPELEDTLPPDPFTSVIDILFKR